MRPKAPGRWVWWFAALAFVAGCKPAAVDPVAPASGPNPFPRELVAFTQHGTGPVFTGAGPGHWDAVIRERGWVLRDGGGYKLWYTGYDGTPTGRRKLGLATSPDGYTWTRHPANPLLTEVWVEDVMVVREGDRYLMFAEGENDRAQLLTSADGVAWKAEGRLDVRLAGGEAIPDGPTARPPRSATAAGGSSSMSARTRACGWPRPTT